MAVCKFYQQGNCKFGDRCRFEHPNRNQQQGNRFGGQGGGGRAANNDLLEKYRLDFGNIQKDLTSEVPQWILSAYAPGRDTPRQLFGGFPREQSFEEMRLHFMEGRAAGNEQVALKQAQDLYDEAKTQMQTAAQDINGAIQYILSAENEHPNRHDICRAGTRGAPFGEFLVDKRSGGFGGNAPAVNNPFAVNNAPAANNPFAANNAPAAPSAFGGGAPQVSAFGQPSAMGAKPSPFGTPALGQPAQANQGNAFGQGAQAQGNVFGQPAQVNQGNVFAQGAQAQGNTFGQPSTMGARLNPFAAPAVGQAAAATPSGVFGQPSQNQGSAFGQPPQTQASAFGQPSQMGTKTSPFATNAVAPGPFSNTTNNAATTNQNQTQPNPFATGPSNTTANPFGQTTQQTPNPFTSSSQATTTAANPFLSNTSSQGSSFSRDFRAVNTESSTSNAFAQQSAASGNTAGQQSTIDQLPPRMAPKIGNAAKTAVGPPYPPGSSKQHPDGYMTRDGLGNLSTFKGQRVIEKDGKPGVNVGGKFVKICFPDGPPLYNKDTALPMEEYDQETLERWKAFERTGKFEDGIMPELPPPREVTTWDF